MQQRIEQIILEELLSSERTVYALEAARNADFFSSREGLIREMFADAPRYLDAITKIAEEERANAPQAPGDLNVVVGRVKRKTHVTFPITDEKSAAYRALQSLGEHYKAKEVQNGRFKAIEFPNPRGEKAELELEDQIRAALNDAYPDVNVIVGNYAVDLNNASEPETAHVSRRGRPRGRRSTKGSKAGSNTKLASRSRSRNAYSYVGENYFEKELTPSALDYSIAHFPTKARSMFPGFKIDFTIIAEDGKRFVSHVTAGDKDESSIGDPKKGTYLSGFGQYWRDTGAKVGDIIHVEHTGPIEYGINLRRSQDYFKEYLGFMNKPADGAPYLVPAKGEDMATVRSRLEETAAFYRKNLDVREEDGRLYFKVLQ